jgi:renalase
MTKPNIAIIGAGLSGLTLAEKLQDRASITIFEKARGIGGRMSTRYTDDFQFDHGAQFFTARTKGFKDFLRPYIDEGTVQEWSPKVVTLELGQKPYKRDWFEPHYTASPKMNMLCKAIAAKHDVRIKSKIEKLRKTPEGWLLTDDTATQHGPFDWVISAAPAPQTAALFPADFTQYADLSTATMQGCYSLILGFKEDLKLNWNAAKVKNSPLGWIAVNSSKPSRETGYSLLVQTTNEWAETHIEDDQDHVRGTLMKELEHLIERPIHNAEYISLHRWRYANTLVLDNQDEKEHKAHHLIDRALNLAACGDWCLNGHVESAYLSATSLAENIFKQ